MMERYELSPEVIEDLLKIQDFISLDSPAAAERVIDQLLVAESGRSCRTSIFSVAGRFALE
jgi:plasmid stabilization system protein ParE